METNRQHRKRTGERAEKKASIPSPEPIHVMHLSMLSCWGGGGGGRPGIGGVFLNSDHLFCSNARPQGRYRWSKECKFPIPLPPPETLCGYRQTEEGPEEVVPCDQPRMKKHLINMY